MTHNLKFIKSDKNTQIKVDTHLMQGNDELKTQTIENNMEIQNEMIKSLNVEIKSNQTANADLKTQLRDQENVLNEEREKHNHLMQQNDDLTNKSHMLQLQLEDLDGTNANLKQKKK
eukprot:70361_1